MSVIFDKEQLRTPPRSYAPPSKKGLTGWLIKKEIVKSESQATLVMLGVIVLCISIAIIALLHDDTPEPPENLFMEGITPGEL